MKHTIEQQKKTYIRAEIEVISFDCVDVIITSFPENTNETEIDPS